MITEYPFKRVWLGGSNSSHTCRFRTIFSDVSHAVTFLTSHLIFSYIFTLGRSLAFLSYPILRETLKIAGSPLRASELSNICTTNVSYTQLSTVEDLISNAFQGCLGWCRRCVWCKTPVSWKCVKTFTKKRENVFSVWRSSCTKFHSDSQKAMFSSLEIQR